METESRRPDADGRRQEEDRRWEVDEDDTPTQPLPRLPTVRPAPAESGREKRDSDRR